MKIAAETRAKELEYKANELSTKEKHAKVDKRHRETIVKERKVKEHKASALAHSYAWSVAHHMTAKASELTQKAHAAHGLQKARAKKLVNTLTQQAAKVKSGRLRKELLGKASNVKKNMRHKSLHIGKHKGKHKRMGDSAHIKTKPKEMLGSALDKAPSLDTARRWKLPWQ